MNVSELALLTGEVYINPESWQSMTPMANSPFITPYSALTVLNLTSPSSFLVRLVLNLKPQGSVGVLCSVTTIGPLCHSGKERELSYCVTSMASSKHPVSDTVQLKTGTGNCFKGIHKGKNCNVNFQM